MKADYGKNPDNPIQLNSIVASRLFLNNLVNESGYHILYHRLGSLPLKAGRPIIDHYEVMSSDNHYDDIFINIYNEANDWTPPAGYLFEDDLADITYFLSDYESEELNESEMKIDEKYLFKSVFADDLEEELAMVGSLPPLERFMHESSGTNGFRDDFPYFQIREIIMSHIMFSPERMEEVISSINPKEKSIFFL